MRAIFALAVAALVLATMPAHANVTYDFIPTWIGANSDGYTVDPDLGPLAWLTVTDAVVEAGSMAFDTDCYLTPCLPYGLVTGSYVIGMGTFNDTYSPNGGLFNVVFNPDGTLSGELHTFADPYTGFDATGTGSTWSGSVGGDQPIGGPIPFTGYWFTPPRDLPHPCCGHGHVPEPSSLSLMLPAIGAMVGLGLRRKLLA